jgi:hypothetical protein
MTQTTTYSLPGQITALVSYPQPPKLTLWEWLGVKPRPHIVPERLYAAIGSTIFISDVNGQFDYSLHEVDEQWKDGNNIAGDLP